MDNSTRTKLDEILEQARTRVKGDWRAYAELKAAVYDHELEPHEYTDFINALSEILEL